MGLLYTLMGYIYYIVSFLYGLFVMGPLAQKPPKTSTNLWVEIDGKYILLELASFFGKF